MNIMKFINNNILKGFANQLDLLNTMNGGVSMTSVDVEQTDNSIIIKVSAPAVSPEAFDVLVDFNKLVVMSELKNQPLVSEPSGDDNFRIPMFFKVFDIPFFVDGNDIEAIYEDGELNIILPIKETGKQLQRKIDIKHQ